MSRDQSAEPDYLKVAAAHGISLTATETRLLTYGDSLRHGIDQQHAYLLARALQPLGCPACGGPTCYRAAIAAPAGETPASASPDPQLACPRCGARLLHHIGLLNGVEWFTLVPGQVIKTGEGPVAGA
jgi:hypothetical protein